MLSSLFSWIKVNSLLAIVWTLLILLACSWPGSDLPEAPVTGFDKIVHVGLFAGFSFLWYYRFSKHFLLIGILGASYGFLIEIYQHYMPLNRSFDLWDILADAVGVILGLLLARLSQNIFNV